MSSSLRNTADSNSISDKKYLKKLYEKQRKIINTLRDQTNGVNSSIKTLSNNLSKIGKSYAKLVALKHHYDLYELYTNDIKETIILCKEEHQKMRKEITKRIQIRETLHNATILYIQDLGYVGLVKNSNISDARALVDLLIKQSNTKHKNISKLQSGVTVIGTKQNSTNRPINTIQNSLEFSNKNNNSRR